MADNTENSANSGADRPTTTPFLAALVIIVIVVIGIALVNVFQGDGLTDEQQVGRAAVGQNDAMQRESFPDFRDFTCAEHQGTEADFLARQRDSVAKNGDRFIDGVTTVQVDGERASATVVYHYDKQPDNKINVETTFVREDGEWRVCSSMGDSRP